MCACMSSDENVDVIYVCPRHLEDDVLHYYTSLLKYDEATEQDDTGIRRFVILTPEAVDYFPVRLITFI